MISKNEWKKLVSGSKVISKQKGLIVEFHCLSDTPRDFTGVVLKQGTSGHSVGFMSDRWNREYSEWEVLEYAKEDVIKF